MNRNSLALLVLCSSPAVASVAYYDGFENTDAGTNYLAARWSVLPVSSPYPNAVGSSTAFQWAPTVGENVSVKRQHVMGEKVPGMYMRELDPVTQLTTTYYLGPKVGGDYWNTAYPIGVQGEFYLGTADVRPRLSDPWNFNPASGTGFADTALDLLTFEATSTTIPFTATDGGVRFVSFLIGGNPGVTSQVSVSVEISDSCRTTPRPVQDVDIYYGTRRSFADIAARIAAQDADFQNVPAVVKPAGGSLSIGDERMSLVIIDLWSGGTVGGVPGNPLAGKCNNGFIRIKDADQQGHLNVDEVLVSDLAELKNRYPSTPFGARAYTTEGDHPPAVYGFADLHTHWMSHIGAGADATPSVTGPGVRKTLRALTAEMGELSGRPYQVASAATLDVCPSNPLGCPAVAQDLAGNCNVSTCALTDIQRDQLALAMCDGDNGGSGKHQDRGGSIFQDRNFRSDSAASMLLGQLDLRTGSGDCGAFVNNCSHNRYGYDYDNHRFHLPARPFMTRIHQQMYWKWVKRAWQGGLRLMVTDVVHNLPLDLLLNNLWAIPNPANEADGPSDVVYAHGADEQYGLMRQVCAVRKLLSKTPAANGGQGAPELDWAEVVFTPQAARRVIENGHLAVVLGAELDSLGALRAGGGVATSEIDFLKAVGVRKVTPIHQLDNVIGGAAVTAPLLAVEQDALNLANGMMSGANCSTSQNFADRLDPTKDVFAELNQWLYGFDQYQNSSFAKVVDDFNYWKPDVYAHLGAGQLACTMTYNNFRQNNLTWCPGSTKENDPEWPNCWSGTHFPRVDAAPNVSNVIPNDQIEFNIGQAFFDDGKIGANAAPNRVGMNHMQTWVTNNNGYVPMFLIAPMPVDSKQRYVTNPLIFGGQGLPFPSNPGTLNAQDLTTFGRRYLETLKGRAMLIDIEHMGQKSRTGAFEVAWPATCTTPAQKATAACQALAYPLLATHSDFRWAGRWAGQRTERTLASTEVMELLQTGGVVGLSTGYEAHQLPAKPKQAAHTFAMLDDCFGSAKSFGEKMLEYINRGEQAGSFWDFGGPGVRRPPHWAAGGVSLGSDFNGAGSQIGPRFNANGGTSCYPKEDMKFAANTTDAEQHYVEQVLASNGVYYGVPTLYTNRSVAPGNGIPAQPKLEKLYFDKTQTPDVYLEEPVDTGGASDYALDGFDFNWTGMANIGLEPDMLQDVVNSARVNDVSTFHDLKYQLRYVFRGAEDFIAAWEKAVLVCKASGSTTCDNNGPNAIDPDNCDIWLSNADQSPTLTDPTASCMARCGQNLPALGGTCRCWVAPNEVHPTDLCHDFKPWCQWHYNGEDDPSGYVRTHSP